MDLKKGLDKELISRIKTRQQVLEDAAKELKRHFVGLDNIIDKIVKDIETWFVMPELLTRPVIICLWGPTGVGKTDLVRRLIKLLHFSNRYCEIEMTNKGSSYRYHNSIGGVLSCNPNIRSGEPSVVLMDEIQNFRTKDENNHEIHDYKFRDIWTLLSDGKLPFEADIEYIMQLLWRYNKKEEKKKADGKHTPLRKNKGFDNEDIKTNASARIEGGAAEIMDDLSDFDDEDNEDWTYYTLNHFKKVLRLDVPIEEIATWTDEKKKATLSARLNDPRLLYEEEDYTKFLIFISGNLDEAYTFAQDAEEADVNADIFHELSQKINVIDIKRSLSARFKPEQIARFGNNHILYPSLSRSFYEIIIDRRIKDIVKRINKNHGIQTIVDKSINDLIYNNGVFPTQGVRPVFSTISEILECLLPKFLLQALIQEEKTLSLFYDKDAICAKIGSKVIRYPYKGTLDNLKAQRNSNLDRKVLTSVHEAGHAVVYASLFKASPPQIVSTTTSHKSEGFICTHETCGAKQYILNKICVWLAGTEAEKIVFGEDNSTWGGSFDLRQATSEASKMIRRYGMDRVKSVVDVDEPFANTDLETTNPMIEELISQGIVRAQKILRDNRLLLSEVIDNLSSRSKLSPQEFRDICKKHGLNISIMKHKQEIFLDYQKQFENFKKVLDNKA